MGSWGTGIYDNDEALDIKDGFQELIGFGINAEEATERLVKFWPQYFGESSVGWVVLAQAQSQLGRLIPSVKTRALSIIEAGADLLFWDDPTLRKQRERVLHDVRSEVIGPQPPEKRVKKTEHHISPFRSGDILRYRTQDGREVGFWVARNQSTVGLLGESSESLLQLAALGQVDLQEIIERGPFVDFQASGDSRVQIRLALIDGENAEPPSWTVLGNEEFPEDPFVVVGMSPMYAQRPRGTREQDLWIDSYVDRWFSKV